MVVVDGWWWGSGGPSIGYGKALGFFFSFFPAPACRYSRDGLADGWWDCLLAPLRVEMS